MTCGPTCIGCSRRSGQIPESGSDQTVFEHDYGETVDLIRETGELGAGEKALLLGATLPCVWGWPRES